MHGAGAAGQWRQSGKRADGTPIPMPELGMWARRTFAVTGPTPGAEQRMAFCLRKAGDEAMSASIRASIISICRSRASMTWCRLSSSQPACGWARRTRALLRISTNWSRCSIRSRSSSRSGSGRTCAGKSIVTP
ncbi:hypothetical protein ABK249_16780 [Neorhizobium sp. Rsf11]|uniref:Uncharacterized protein n=1 Tax=Neorhizobium phenanthreniclasticum TaxID=3157917 RepID=A0ABV0M3X6_9HYPH